MFLLGAGNRLFLPSTHVNITGYCEKKMFPKLRKIIDTAFKLHPILQKLLLVLEISFP